MLVSTGVMNLSSCIGVLLQRATKSNFQACHLSKGCLMVKRSFTLIIKMRNVKKCSPCLIFCLYIGLPYKWFFTWYRCISWQLSCTFCTVPKWLFSSRGSFWCIGHVVYESSNTLDLNGWFKYSQLFKSPDEQSRWRLP